MNLILLFAVFCIGLLAGWRHADWLDACLAGWRRRLSRPAPLKPWHPDRNRPAEKSAEQ
ncbi:hypothetical protein [Noviherbaspirillum humi]|uniref:hypothetical protein n=1 Tax=Noviherbaspirillum humi TaxID=1688639 RepID=UPI0015960CCC|nr:hypothetical protein [Noviherbaspirillum humi]